MFQFCDNCDTIIKGSAAAKTHYSNCTQDSDTEGLHASSFVEPDERELLIAEVFTREPLWNALLPYAERSFKVTSALWHEIDIALGKQKDCILIFTFSTENPIQVYYRFLVLAMNTGIQSK